MYADVDSRTVGGGGAPPIPAEWEKAESLAKRLNAFTKFRYEYRIMWKRRALAFRTDMPEFGMRVIRRNFSPDSGVTTVVECFEPEHAESVLRMLIVAEEDRETDYERSSRKALSSIEKHFGG